MTSTNHYTAPLCPQCGIELPAQKINLCGEIARVIRQRPDLTYAHIGLAYDISARTVKRYARRAGLHRKRGARPRLVQDGV
jgi:hypothetical protein